MSDTNGVAPSGEVKPLAWARRSTVQFLEGAKPGDHVSTALSKSSDEEMCVPLYAHPCGVALPATASAAHRLADEFYNGTSEKDWPAWAQEAVVILERAAAHDAGVAPTPAPDRADVQFLIDLAAKDVLSDFERRTLVRIARQVACGVPERMKEQGNGAA